MNKETFKEKVLGNGKWEIRTILTDEEIQTFCELNTKLTDSCKGNIYKQIMLMQEINDITIEMWRIEKNARESESQV